MTRRWGPVGLSAMLTLYACALPAEEVPPDAPPCVTYCTFAFLNCSNSPILYTDWNTCAASCGAFDSSGEPGATRGNTLQCRLTYVQVADQAPQAFCENAGPQGGTDCI